MCESHTISKGLEMLSNRICDENRPVTSAGASNRNGDVGLPLFLVLRNEKVEKSLQPAQELASFRLGVQELDHARILSCQGLQVRYEMRVRQEANIEYEI